MQICISQLEYDKGGNAMEDYFFSTEEQSGKEKKAYVLIIYDIVDNSRRTKLAKFLQGYGFRVQKSAFEALISHSLYNKLFREIEKFVTKEDSIRIYKIIGQGQVTVLGKQENVQQGDCIVI